MLAVLSLFAACPLPAALSCTCGHAGTSAACNNTSKTKAMTAWLGVNEQSRVKHILNRRHGVIGAGNG